MAGWTEWCNGCRGPLPPQPCAWCPICGHPAPGYGGAPPGSWPQPDAQFEGYDDGKKNLNCCIPFMQQQVTAPRGIPSPPLFPPAHGRKRALLIGITYKRSHWLGGRRLKGAGNDVKWMKYLLQKCFKFPEECILVLTDEEQTDPSRLPTRDNMVAAMQWLVRGCQQGTSLVFYFSGHGTQQKDQDGDEMDGLDEVLCPMDYRKSGGIVDDDINQMMVRPLPAGVKLHAFIDACYSGSALDLDFVCNNRNGIYQWERYSRKSKGTSGGYAVCFSSCRDDQTSEETDFFTRSTVGAMTYCLIEAVEKGTSIQPVTYAHILQQMCTSISNAKPGIFKRFSQVTQLSSSVKFDIYRAPFVL